MKKIISIMAGIIFPLSVMAQSADIAAWASFGRYEKDNERVKALPAEQRRVVFFGDSITECWEMAHPQFFTSNGFIGRGISGQTSYQFMARFERDVLDLQPETMVLNVATNDIAENTCPYNPDATFDNIVAMVARARLAGIRVVLTTTLPAARIGWRPDIKDAPGKIQMLNARLREYAASRGITFVDYYSALVLPDGVTLNPDYSKDGVHPTAEGYDVMEAIILEALK